MIVIIEIEGVFMFVNYVNQTPFQSKYNRTENGLGYEKSNVGKIGLTALGVGTGLVTGISHSKGFAPANTERKVVGYVRDGLKKIHINIDKLIPKANTKSAGIALAAGHILIGLGLGAAVDAGINASRKSAAENVRF